MVKPLLRTFPKRLANLSDVLLRANPVSGVLCRPICKFFDWGGGSMLMGPAYCVGVALIAFTFPAIYAYEQTSTSGALSGIAKTDRDGAYHLFFLRPGPYKLSVTHSGFQEECRSGWAARSDAGCEPDRRATVVTSINSAQFCGAAGG